jgi:hypothetical protein
MKNLTELFCSIDDFWKEFENYWKNKQLSYKKPRGPSSSISISEIMTLMILFHQSNFRTFKYFYLFALSTYKNAFPGLPSYSRFVSMQKTAFIPFFAYLLSIRGKISGISFIDSTVIKVCHIKRSYSNKVFRRIAKKGKSTIGWFFGFKLHLIVNEIGEILSFQITPGNKSDIATVKSLSKGIWGKLFGDKGYISHELFKELLEKNLQLITRLRSNMRNKLMHVMDKILLRKRAIIESINDQLKNISQIEHSRHRSPCNFLVNLLSGLAAYAHQDKKPSLKIQKHIFLTC